MIHIVAEGRDLAVFTPFDREFVKELKETIPGVARKWKQDRRYWLIDAAYGTTLQSLIQRHYFVQVALPVVADTQTAPKLCLLDVRYIGMAHLRDDGSESAFAWRNDDWSVVFPKSVLMSWFGVIERPDEAKSYYAVLGVQQDASQEELKKAWKRLVRQWHPDVCKETDATAQFMAIQAAYEVLAEPVKRSRYDAGLLLEASFKKQPKSTKESDVFAKSNYRSPLRSGLILALGNESLGRFVVSKILEWKDVVNEQGEILVSYWSDELQHVQEKWVAP